MAKKSTNNVVNQAWILVVLSIVIGFVIGFLVGKAVTTSDGAATGEGFSTIGNRLQVQKITNVDSCREIIKPGAYKLANDIYVDTEPSSGACIAILTSDVVLDCNNHLIYGDDNSPLYTSGIRIGPDRNTIKNCRISNVNGYAILMGGGSENKVINSQLTSNLYTGIFVNGISDASQGNIIQNNIIRFNGLEGIYIFGRGYYLSNNVVCNNGAEDIRVGEFENEDLNVKGTQNKCSHYLNYHDEEKNQGCTYYC